MAFSLCACSNEEETTQKESVQFGTFGYNSAVFTDYAVNSISAEKAKEILPLSNNKETEEVASTMSLRNVIGSVAE